MTCDKGVACQYNLWGRRQDCTKADCVVCPMERKQEAKADAGKLQIHQVPMQIVRDIAEVRMYGTGKYGDENNWRQVELMRYVDALLRHTLAFAEDIHSVDEESGIPHYKHMECNLAFISEMMRSDADGRAGGKTAAAAGE